MEDWPGNVKETLDVTTHMNIRSAILPLIKRYRTYLLSQKLKRLSTKFFNDTLFANNASV